MAKKKEKWRYRSRFGGEFDPMSGLFSTSTSRLHAIVWALSIRRTGSVGDAWNSIDSSGTVHSKMVRSQLLLVESRRECYAHLKRRRIPALEKAWRNVEELVTSLQLDAPVATLDGLIDDGMLSILGQAAKDVESRSRKVVVDPTTIETLKQSFQVLHERIVSSESITFELRQVLAGIAFSAINALGDYALFGTVGMLDCVTKGAFELEALARQEQENAVASDLIERTGSLVGRLAVVRDWIEQHPTTVNLLCNLGVISATLYAAHAGSSVAAPPPPLLLPPGQSDQAQ